MILFSRMKKLVWKTKKKKAQNRRRDRKVGMRAHNPSMIQSNRKNETCAFAYVQMEWKKTPYHLSICSTIMFVDLYGKFFREKKSKVREKYLKRVQHLGFVISLNLIIHCHFISPVNAIELFLHLKNNKILILNHKKTKKRFKFESEIERIFRQREIFLAHRFQHPDLTSFSSFFHWAMPCQT